MTLTKVVGYTRGGTQWRPRFLDSIDPDKCIVCGRCYKVCGRQVLELIEKPFDGDDEYGDDMGNKVMSVANPDDCTGCEACNRTCTKRAHLHVEL